MALSKGKIFLKEPQHGDDKMITGYIQNVDQVGVMVNSQSDGKGILTIYPAHNVYRVEIPPLPGANIMMPNISTLRRN